jgi:hypothetical protein
MIEDPTSAVVEDELELLEDVELPTFDDAAVEIDAELLTLVTIKAS